MRKRRSELTFELLSLRLRNAVSAEKLATCAVLAAFWEVELREAAAAAGYRGARGLSGTRHRWSRGWEPPKRRAVDKAHGPR